MTPAQQKIHDRLEANGEYDIYDGNKVLGPIGKPTAKVDTLSPEEAQVIDDLKLGNKISRDSLADAISEAVKEKVTSVMKAWEE